MTITADDAGKKVSALITVPDGQEIDTITINGEVKTANTKVAEGDEVVVTFKDVTTSEPDTGSTSDGDDDKSETSSEKKALFCAWDFI